MRARVLHHDQVSDADAVPAASRALASCLRALCARTHSQISLRTQHQRSSFATFIVHLSNVRSYTMLECLTLITLVHPTLSPELILAAP